MSKSNPTFELARPVRWSELDCTGEVQLPNYVRMMEETEYAFLRSRGLSVVLQDERGTLGFPRISVDIKVIQGARSNEMLYTTLELTRADFKQIGYSFEIVNEQAELIAVGSILAACCRFPQDELPYAILTPDFVLEALTGKGSEIAAE